MDRVPSDDVNDLDNSKQIKHDEAPLLQGIERLRWNDPFIERDIYVELLDALQVFDLVSYGGSLIKCILAQLQKQSRDS